uniref:uncharacterized protein LOC120347903 n=1 Tax=Styela clava TaxID=7725 RepID=UPI00193A5482|nr:uncharacterized protein LOC120347903 [Styela clava]
MNICVGVLLLAFILVSEAQLRSSGENVCHRVDQRSHTYLFKTKKMIVKEKRVDCWDISQNFRCLRKLYEPVYEPRTRVVHVPVFYCCAGTRLEGSRCVREIPTNIWTRSPSGCDCYFNGAQDCACCEFGGCQCDRSHPDKCVQCGYGHTCSAEYDDLNSMGLDGWTLTETGCKCDGSPGAGPCPCCQNRGCPCKKGRTTRCSQCGLPEMCFSVLE